MFFQRLRGGTPADAGRQSDMDTLMGMLLSVRGIRKSFGAVAALRHADLDMAEGEVVALLGDNGAGKSTFVRLLSGAGRPDGGTFRFGGNPVDLAKYSVRKARDMGIETVHQDRCLCEGQSLWRNMFVGRHVRTRWGFIDIAAEREATRVMLGVLLKERLRRHLFIVSMSFRTQIKWRISPLLSVASAIS